MGVGLKSKMTPMVTKVLSKIKTFLRSKKILTKYVIYLQNYTQNQVQNIKLKKKFLLVPKSKLQKKKITFTYIRTLGYLRR